MSRVLAIALMLSVAAPVMAAPGSQLTQSVAQRLKPYGIRIDPGSLTTSQAAALHILLGEGKPWLTVRSRAHTILTSPEFRD